jgi:hypothetical protein
MMEAYGGLGHYHPTCTAIYSEEYIASASCFRRREEYTGRGYGLRWWSKIIPPWGRDTGIIETSTFFMP